MTINSYYPVLCVASPETLSGFLQKHFHFVPAFQNDWYIHLTQPNQPEVNVALVKSDHESVPVSMRKTAQGILLNFEYDEVETRFQEFKKADLTFLLELRDEPWGQRHFILQAPEGVMIDVIQLIEPSDEFKAAYSG